MSRIAGALLGERAHGEIADSSHLLGRPAALRERLAEHGHVLLRGLLPVSEVLAGRAEVLAALRAVGEVTGEAVATGASRRAELHDLSAFWRGVCEGPAVRRAVHHARLRAAAAMLLGAAVVPFDFVWLRAMPPGRASPFHLDHPYMNRGSARLLTAWVPLGEVRAQDGPIALVEGSHLWDDITARVRGRDVDRDPGFNASFTDDIPALAASRGARILSAAFRPGDVLIFNMFLLHGSLDNAATDGRVRLSADVRFQPGADGRDDRWFGAPPPGHGGRSYAGLSGAQPLTAPPIVR
jgi:hypothetical protein